MNTFAAAPVLQSVTPLDPTKHVNYELGMVLGVDDFRQEFVYLSGRDRWQDRDLIGYGTAVGLAVTFEASGAGPRIVVAPGAAVMPTGQLVCVSPAQCADVNEWLAANADEVARHVATHDDPLSLYLVLCPRECETDKVPIPG